MNGQCQHRDAGKCLMCAAPNQWAAQKYFALHDKPFAGLEMLLGLREVDTTVQFTIHGQR